MISNTMTLYDIIEELTELRDNLIAEGKDDDIKVVSSSNYGDRSSTEQLIGIESIEVVSPIKSGYSRSGYAYPDDEDGNEEEVIVLRYR